MNGKIGEIAQICLDGEEIGRKEIDILQSAADKDSDQALLNYSRQTGRLQSGLQVLRPIGKISDRLC